MARRLTLTFDNGSDPELTPHVLDTLAFDAVAAGAIIFHAVTGLDSHAIAAVATQVRRTGPGHDLVSGGHELGIRLGGYPQAKYLGGGTNLVDLLREMLERPAALVDVTGLSPVD